MLIKPEISKYRALDTLNTTTPPIFADISIPHSFCLHTHTHTYTQRKVNFCTTFLLTVRRLLLPGLDVGSDKGILRERL